MKFRGSLIAILLIASAFTLNSCTGAGGGSVGASLANIPKDDYNLVFTVHPSKIYNSELVQNLIDDVDADRMERSLNDFEKKFGTKLEDFELFVAAMDIPGGLIMGETPEKVITYWGGSFKEDTFTDGFKQTVGAETIEEGEDSDSKYFKALSDTGEVAAFMMTDGGAVAGLEESVKDYIAMVAGNGESLQSDAEFTSLLALLDGEASAALLIYDIKSLTSTFLAFASGMAEDDETKDFFTSLADFDALGLSARLDADLHFSAKLKFAESGSAKNVADFLNKKKGDFKADDLKSTPMSPLEGLMLDDDEVDEIIETTKIEASGNVVTISQTIKGDSSFFDGYKKSLGEADTTSAQYDTTDRIMQLGQAIEHYIMNNSIVGCPKANSLNELIDIFEETGITFNYELLTDGWGNLFIYEPDMTPGSRSYRLISYGTDKAPGPQPAIPGLVKKPEEDIIFANGRFVQRHEGPSTR